MTHIVVLPFPLSGHLIPLLQLSQALVALGFTVTFVHTKSLRSLVLQLLSTDERKLQQEQPLGIRLVLMSDDQQLLQSWDGFREQVVGFENLRSIFERLVETLAPFDCILSDALLGWAQDIANKFGVPRFAFWTSSAAEFQIYAHAPKLISAGDLPFKPRPDVCLGDEQDNLIPGLPGKRPVYHRATSGDECPRVPGLPSLRRGEFPLFLQIEDASDIMFQYFVKQTQRVPEAYAVIFNSLLELEADVFSCLRAESVNAYALGPFFLLKEALISNSQLDVDKEDRCLTWLDKQPANSVLYVAFGSMGIALPGQYCALAQGLEASQQRFLWAISYDRGAEECAPFPPGFLERTKERGMVVDWAPQRVVLGHPSVGGFLSHCGWNSFLESITVGVPIIGFPLWADHSLICKFLVDEWRVGMRLEADGDGLMRSEDVERLARELMEGSRGKELRRQASRWNVIVKQALEEGGSSRNCLHTLQNVLGKLDELKTTSPSTLRGT